MGKEIRRVPKNWKHPKDINGSFQPQFYKLYGEVLDEWLENKRQWDNGTHRDLLDDPSLKEQYPDYSEWGGEAPNKKYYRQIEFKEKELTHIQLYENLSEGTPISPLFKASEFDKLCEYASKNCYIFAKEKASADEWKRLLNGESAIITSEGLDFFNN